jgi:hypothetical protein
MSTTYDGLHHKHAKKVSVVTDVTTTGWTTYDILEYVVLTVSIM